MARKFTTGRQNDLVLNQELHEALMALKYFNNGAIEPIQDKQAPIPVGAIWNDRGRGKNIIKINKSDGQWTPAFEGYYLPANLLINPLNPTNGQIRINASKDNLMEFYDQNTNSWIAVKAAQYHSTNILVDMHNNFMHMTPLNDMDLIEGQKTFLIPYEKAGKLFDNGTFIHPSSDEYKPGSDVSVIYNSNRTDTQESWVHINPGKLYKTEKKLVKIIKTGTHAFKVYGAYDDNTEFYMLDSDGLGTLMIPSRTDSEVADFVAFDEGIELLSDRARNAEYIFVISHVFYYDSARVGKLVKRDFTIGSTAEIKIGLLNKRPMIFLDGLYLEQSKYDYDFQTGNVEIDDTIINPMDMMAVVFQDYEGDRDINYITGPNEDTKVGTFSKASNFIKPLAFVSGIMGTNIVDPEEMYFEDSTLVIKNFGPEVINSPVKVMVVEADNMYLAHGTLNDKKTIQHEQITDNPADEYLLFVDGLLISSRDLDISEGEIRIANAYEGQQYVLLKIQDDSSTSLSFDSKVMNFTVAITNDDGTFYNECDNVTVYANGKLVPTEDAVLKMSLPIKGATGQIVKVKSKDTDSVYNYYMWNEDKAVWDMITEKQQVYDLDAISKATYSSGSVMLDSTNLENTTGTYYAYTYANRIEEPLLKGQRDIVSTKKEYAVNVEHSFNTGQGAFSAYLDGILCPSIKESSNVGKFVLPDLIADEGTDPYEPTLTYYIERPESKELISCYREVLTAANRNTQYDNAYNTTLSLIPGTVALYVNGVRLEKEEYSIISPHTFILHTYVVGSQKHCDLEDESTWNKYMIYDNTSRYEIECYRGDEITVEVREDYLLKSQTIPVRYPGQRAFFMEDDGIPRTLLLTQDIIKIYIDGVLYDGEYIIDRDNDSIVLLDPDLEHIMKVDPIARYFDMYPEEHDAYILEHNGRPYVARPQTNRITFEWR